MTTTRKRTKAVDLTKSAAEFQAKIDAIRASRSTAELAKVRDDFDIPGFCKHGIPKHCPHCAKESL